MRLPLTLCLLFVTRLLIAQSDYYIRFPDDILTTNCVQSTLTPPQLYNPNGLNITIDYQDAIIDPIICYEVERNWYVKGPNYNPQQGCVTVPNPNPSAILNNPVNLPGAVIAAPGDTLANWQPTWVKISPADAAATNYAVFYTGGTYSTFINGVNTQTTVPPISAANCYRYNQHIKIEDAYPPEISNCPTAPLVFTDSSSNNPQLWNAGYWYDPVLQTNNLSDGPVDLSLAAFDSCAGVNVDFRYLLFLDLDGDGAQETVVNSGNPPAAGLINYNNVASPNFTGGIPRVFDQHTVDPNLKYRFGIRTAINGNKRIGKVVWYTNQNPNDALLPQLPAGTHRIKWIIGDNCGNETVCDYFFTIVNANFSAYHTLRGKVQADDNLDCLSEPNEVALQKWNIQLDHLSANDSLLTTEYGSLGTDSQYYFLVDTGRYRLTALPPNDYFVPCTDTILTVTAINDASTTNFSTQFAVDCPFLETDVSTPILRRCFDNTYTVWYCNTGTAAAENAFIRVKLDPFLAFVDASQPALAEGDQVWRFDLGSVPINDCGTFTFKAYLNCDSTVLGQTHCVEAHIYPDSFCLPPLGWSGANVEVQGTCDPDSVRFVLRNTGPAGTSQLNYIVIEDNIITLQLPFQIPAEESIMVSVPANGSTWRLEAEQEPGNPYNPMPSATVEACGQNESGDISIGFVSQFGENDGNPFVSIDCQQSKGAYDPNDKQGYPLGYGFDHLIEPGQPLDYLIRFQNTGTDTAFTVAVLDTLAPWLDPISVTPGASSHPYHFRLSEAGILTFSFENILLPDSNVNEVASHGFVKFRVQQRNGLPLGTIINNRAAIYFDFNAPVFTNETQHQVGHDFVTSSAHDLQKTPTIRVSPNPASSGTMLYFENGTLPQARFELYDTYGRLVMNRNLSGNGLSLEGTHLPAGLYFFKIFGNGKLQGVGKLSMVEKTGN